MEEQNNTQMQETQGAEIPAEEAPAAEVPAADPFRAKTMRRTVNHTFKWLFLYNLFQLAIYGIVLGIGVLLVMKAPAVSGILMNNGLGMIVSTLLAAGLVYLCTSKRWKVNPFKRSGKKMTGRDFATLFGIFAISQIITLIVALITDALGIGGTSVEFTYTVPMVIYVSLTGPFVEELMYRGFSVGTMGRKGLIPAIVLSSLAFGLMHGNLSQLVVGTFGGLLLGFVFSEYSIWWAFLIHLINNSVSACLSWVVPAAYQNTAAMIIYAGYLGFAVFGIISLFKRKAEVKEWFARPENHMQKGEMKGIFSSAWLYIFAVIYLIMIVTMMMFPQTSAMLGK